MNGSDKKLKELAIILRQKNNSKIAEAIKSLRQGPPLEGAIELLVALYDRSDDTVLKKIVREFMNDIKGQMVSGEVIAEIKKGWQPDTINMLVSSCWQSGLDYSDYCHEFAEMFLSSDYITAIECFTVIESSAENLKAQQKDMIIRIIEENPLPPGDEKTSLLKELLFLLRQSP